MTLFFAGSERVQFLLVLSISTYSFSVFVFEVVKRHANALASKTLPASSVHYSILYPLM